MSSYKNIFFLLFLGLLIGSCKREMVTAPVLSSFAVTADSMSTTADTAYYSLGSKSTFNFSGNPFTITFFSGETGHRYEYRNRTSALGTARLIFSNALNSGAQQGTLHVMLSSDFKGVAYDTSASPAGYPTNMLTQDSAQTVANIAAATWMDITPAMLATNATPVIDTIDLSGHSSTGKPVTIAFKYTAQAGAVQNKWTINNLSVTNSLPDGTVYTIGNLNATTTAITNYGISTINNPGWVAYTAFNNYNWTVNAGSSLVIAGATTAAAATDMAEAWTFMGPLDLTKVTPDAGVIVKGITSLPTPFPYLYTARGTYKATFLAGNNSQYSTDTILKAVPVVIR